MTSPLDHWLSIERTRELEVTAEHLLLLQRANFDWTGVDWGAPGLSHKRPFGNSDIAEDIAEIVDGPLMAALGPGGREDHVEANADRYYRLLAELTHVLQIAIDTGALWSESKLEPSRYVRDDRYRWRRADSSL